MSTKPTREYTEDEAWKHIKENVIPSLDKSGYKELFNVTKWNGCSAVIVSNFGDGYHSLACTFESMVRSHYPALDANLSKYRTEFLKLCFSRFIGKEAVKGSLNVFIVMRALLKREADSFLVNELKAIPLFDYNNLAHSERGADISPLRMYALRAVDFIYEPDKDLELAYFLKYNDTKIPLIIKPVTK